MTLDQTCNELGAAYKDWKIWEEAKNTYKEVFYELADEEITKLGLMTKTATYPGDAEKARERAKRHNPGWKIEEAREHSDGWTFILFEDPSYKSFSHEVDDVKYARQVARGAVMIDDEWLLEDSPELYEAVTFELPWGDRVPIPLERIDKGSLGWLQKYIYNAKPKATLAAPRPVKKD